MLIRRCWLASSENVRPELNWQARLADRRMEQVVHLCVNVAGSKADWASRKNIDCMFWCPADDCAERQSAERQSAERQRRRNVGRQRKRNAYWKSSTP